MSQTIPSIDGYAIEDELGRGAMGVVYRARQLNLDRPVALKVMAEGVAEDQDFADRFLREARAAAGINSPHVVACYDAGTRDGRLFMALELVTGGDGTDLLANGAVDVGRALRVIRDAARGLEAVEAAGLIHRDIKPANLFLDSEGNTKLADLGLIRPVADSEMTMAGAVLGTPAYMAPEQARGEPGLDIRVDIHGLGAALYQLLTGRLPYHGEHPMATLAQVIGPDLPEIPEDLPPPVRAVLLRMLAKDRADRHLHAKELREDLDCIINGGPPVHTEVPDDPAIMSGPQPVPVKARQPRRSTSAGDQASAGKSAGNGSAADADRSGSTVATPPTPAGPVLLSSDTPTTEEEAVKHADCIYVAKDGLSAWINLGVGARFPRQPLEKLLEKLHVVYGLDDGALTDATRITKHPRRLILARGDPPSPGMPGKSIHGDTIPALDEDIIVRIREDGMEAYALTRPGVLVERDLARGTVRKAGICFGLDKEAVRCLYKGPASASGRCVIARGRRTIEGVPAGFHLASNVANTTVNDAVTQNLQRVRAGVVLAIWQETVPGQSGMDVLGMRRAPKPLPEHTPQDFVGEGVELSRARDGSLELRSVVAGLCQQQSNGCIRVVEATEIEGDITPDKPVESSGLVVVRGNVTNGSSIKAAGDVVICGDLQDACIETGGDVQIQGNIEAGEQSIVAGGQVSADNIAVRKVMAGSVVIRGTVRHCELVTTGDIEVDEVIGGRLEAGGSIRVKRAGDSTRSPTELWAGHHNDYLAQQEQQRVVERSVTMQRRSIIEQECALSRECEHVEARLRRLGQGFTKGDAARQLSEERRRLADREATLEARGENLRKEIAQRRQVLDQLDELGNNDSAQILIEECVNPGVTIRVASAEGERIRRRRDGGEWGMGKQEGLDNDAAMDGKAS